MVDEEKQAEIGRIVEEYLECKKKLAANQSEAQKIADNLTQISANLRALSQLTSPGSPEVVEFIGKQVDAFPSGESLRTLAGRITIETERKHELHETLKNLGIEPKD
jgi:hypothetical protein